MLAYAVVLGMPDAMGIASNIKRFAKNAGKDRVLGKQLPAAYSEAANAPVNPRKAVFANPTSAQLPSSFGLIWRELERRGFDLEYRCLGKGSVDWGSYVRNCDELVRSAATAGLVFLDDASDVMSCLPLRPETRVAQLWHACGAFKRWGMATAGLGHGASAADIDRHPGYENLSLVSVSSPEVIPAYAEAMNLAGREDIIKPLGVSRTDVFFDPAFRSDARRQLDAAFPEAVGRKVVFYAPTFRGAPLSAQGPGELDIALLRERLGDGCALVVKHHPFVKQPPAIPPDCRGFAFDASSAGLPVNMLLCAADVLVTDYSSVIFEYALLDRPMAFFAPDLDEYNDGRSFFYPYEEMTPGPIVKATSELADALEAQLRGDFDRSGLAAFRERFMSACDGRSTERILAALLGE